MGVCVNRVFEISLHALSGVRVDGAAPRGLWPPAGGRLCRRVVKEKVLRIDRPAAGGFLSLTAFQAEGCGIALRAMSIKSALRIHLSVSYGMIGILLIGSLRSPPPIRLRRTSPAVRSVNRKEGPFMGRLRAYFDRLAHPMQDVHRGRIKLRKAIPS